MRPATIILLSLLVFLTPAAHAQRSSERQPILAAVRDFSDALDAADPARLTPLIWVDTSVSQQLARELFVKLLLAEKRLERAGATTFGAAGGARFRCNLSQINTPEDRAALTLAEVYHARESRDVAWVQKPGETYPVRLRRSLNDGGRWQVVLEALDRDMEDDTLPDPPQPNRRAQCRLEYYEAMIAGVEEVAGRIEKGEFGSAAAAEADLFDRMEQALEEFITKRNALNVPRRGPRNRYYR